jgi:hypothetical protein
MNNFKFQPYLMIDDSLINLFHQHVGAYGYMGDAVVHIEFKQEWSTIPICLLFFNQL